MEELVQGEEKLKTSENVVHGPTGVGKTTMMERLVEKTRALFLRWAWMPTKGSRD